MRFGMLRLYEEKQGNLKTETKHKAKHLNHKSKCLGTFRKLNTTAKCQHCGKEVVLPFKCSYCNGYFCAEHRLPENHACPESWRARAPREEAPPIIVERKPTRPSYKYTITYAPQPTAKVFWFSTTELKHLTIGTLLVMGVGLSYIPYIGLTRKMGPEILVGLAIAFTLSFLLHELAHKFSAQHLGLWAEFRLTMQGALITLISMLLPFFKIISPGAMMIAGPATKETAGKTALSGPLTNVILSTICTTIAATTQNIFFWIVAWINAFIAFFNLIPFGIMDGLKMFWWSKKVWALAFIASVALMIYTYGPISSF
jgi:Zn-dependent protease